MSLTPAQAKLVRSSVPVLQDQGERIASIFYATMLSEHEELREYFNTVHQKTGRQPRALTAIILAFAANISHTSELIPRLERVCHKHCSLDIRPEQYAVVGEYLIRAFHEVLGAAMTDELQAAWTAAYGVLARMMMGREAHLYRGFGPWRGWRKMRVERKVAESDDVYSFYLAPVVDKAASLSSPTAHAPSHAPSHASSHASSQAQALPAVHRTTSHSSTATSFLGRPRKLRAKIYGSTTPAPPSSDKTRASATLSPTPSTTSVAPSSAPATLPHFLPGQYVSVRMPTTGSSGSSTTYGVPQLPPFQSRQYSLSDRWQPDYYRISVKRDEGTRYTNAVSSAFFRPGLVSNALIDTVEVGDAIDVSHPAGEFVLPIDDLGTTANVPLVLISAGVGASPMMAMLSAVCAAQPARAVTYVHGSRCRPPIFASQIQQLQRAHPHMRTAYFFSGSSGGGGGGGAHGSSTAYGGRLSSGASATSTSSSRTGSSHSTMWRDRDRDRDRDHELAQRLAFSSFSPSLSTSTTTSAAESQPATYEFAGHIDLSRLVPGVGDPHSPPEDSYFAGSLHSGRASTVMDDEDLLHLGSNIAEYYVCGPEDFMLDMAVRLVHGLGVSRHRIHYELFSTGDLELEEQDSRMSYIR